jgi:ribosomal protein S18 acetylase RimI-like enzyme
LKKLDFRIRNGYRPDEIPRLREIERECFEFGVAWNLTEFKENLPKAQIWIAETRDEPIGFLVSWVERKVPHIASIDVAGKYRGHGVASSLVAECERHFTELGYENITLLVHTDNPAQTLYFKLGYRAVKFYQNCEYGSQRKNMLKMQKALRS